MIKSKYKIVGGFGIVVAVIVIFFAVIAIVLTQPYDQAENGGLPLGFFLFWIGVAIIFVLHQMLTRINKISIQGNRVLYTNVLWRRQNEISLDEIDGFKYKIEISRINSHELIILKKGEKKLLRISSFYYSNFNEMKVYFRSRLREL